MVKIRFEKHKIETQISITGSKSLSNRLLMIRAISDLDIAFKNLSDSEDTVTLAKVLGQINGSNHAELNIGHAGTDMRFLTTFLSNKKGAWVLSGSDRMKHRPIGELVNVLRSLGAQIDYLEHEGFPPLKITGNKMNGGKVAIDGSISSQFITSLLLIAPALENGLTLELKGQIVSKPYITMTIELMKKFGIEIYEETNCIRVIKGKYNYNEKDFFVESDWSSASYWYSIVALADEAEVELNFFNEKSLQADSVVAEIYRDLGVNTERTKTSLKLSKSNSVTKKMVYDFIECPDIAQTVIATCVGLNIEGVFSGLQTLKIKETDRIKALQIELEKFGARLEVTDSTIALQKNEALIKPLETIKTYHDHRMAMSIAPLVLRFEELNIENPDVVNKSYNSYWADLEKAGFSIDKKNPNSC